MRTTTCITRLLGNLFLLAGLLSGSCISEQTEVENPVPPTTTEGERREVLLTLKNKLALTGSATRADGIATKEENAVATLDVYVFASATEGGTYTYQERFAYRAEGQGELPEGATSLPLAVDGADNESKTTGLLSLRKGLFVKFYCVANAATLKDPATGNAVEAAAYQPLKLDEAGTPGVVAQAGKPTETEFLTYHTPLLSATEATDMLVTPLPMSGAYTTPLDLTDAESTSRLQVGFKLTRLVARFDVVNKATESKFIIQSISIGNGRRGASFFPITAYGAQPAGADELITYTARTFDGEISIPNANKGLTTGAFYSYPSPLNDQGYLILNGLYQVNLSETKEVSYQVPFHQKLANGTETRLDITHNHRYTIGITKADDYHLDFTLSVDDWADDGSIDPFDPEEIDPDDFAVTVDNPTDIDTKYDDATRTVTMSLAPGTHFTVKTGCNNLFMTHSVSYGANLVGYEWLKVTQVTPPLSRALAASQIYEYKVSLNTDYKGTRFPRARIRFTDGATAVEKAIFVEAIAAPEIQETTQEAANSINTLEVTDASALATMYRFTNSQVKVGVRCPDGVTTEGTPDWLDVTSTESGIVTTFKLTLKDIAVSTGETDKTVEIVFKNKKVESLVTTLKLFLEDDLKPNFSALDGTNNTFTDAVDNTLANIKMPIVAGNTFTVKSLSPIGVQVLIDYGTGTPGWLNHTNTETRALISSNMIFSLVDAKLSGATTATVTLKNKIAGKDYKFTVSPEFQNPTFAQSAATSGSSLSGATMTLAALKAVQTPSVTISVNSLGGSKLTNLPAWITASQLASTNTTTTYKLDLNVGHSSFPASNPGAISFQIENGTDATKSKTVSMSITEEVYYTTNTSNAVEGSEGSNYWRFNTSSGGTVWVYVYSVFEQSLSLSRSYASGYGDGGGWITTYSPTLTKENNRRKYTLQTNLARVSSGTDQAYQLHLGTITVIKNGVNYRSFNVYRGASTLGYPVSTGYYSAVIYGGRYWAPVNLGASRISTAPGSDGAAGNGFYYQWGRNLRFDTNFSKYDGSGALPSSPSASLNGVWWGRFITGTEGRNYNWVMPGTSGMESFWSSSKQSADPCPSGWRVPTYSELSTLTGTGSNRSVSGYNILTIVGSNGLNLVFPEAGFISKSGNPYFGSEDTGIYWSSTVTGTQSHSLVFSTGTFSLQANNRVTGVSVRCIRQ